MIPKIIHFVWVGDQPKSDLVLKCIATWKKYLPDYEIVEWGNDAFTKIENIYAQQAYENKKWAFVSDYLRLHALKYFGGFYFDTDLEITSDISEFRALDFVTGYELYKGKVFPATALMGSVANQRIISELLSYYEGASFKLKDGLDLTPNTQRISEYFERMFDLQGPYSGDALTELSSTEKIFPYGYFCTPSVQHENYAIHHFSGSWVDGYVRKKIFSLGPFSLLKFKKKTSTKDDLLPLIGGEVLLSRLKINTLKVYGLVFSRKKE